MIKNVRTPRAGLKELMHKHKHYILTTVHSAHVWKLFDRSEQCRIDLWNEYRAPVVQLVVEIEAVVESNR